MLCETSSVCPLPRGDGTPGFGVQGRGHCSPLCRFWGTQQQKCAKKEMIPQYWGGESPLGESISPESHVPSIPWEGGDANCPCVLSSVPTLSFPEGAECPLPDGTNRIFMDLLPIPSSCLPTGSVWWHPRVPQRPWLSFRGREVCGDWLCPELPPSPPPPHPREEGSSGSHSNQISFSAPNFTQPGLRRRNGKGRGNANDPQSLQPLPIHGSCIPNRGMRVRITERIAGSRDGETGKGEMQERKTSC